MTTIVDYDLRAVIHAHLADGSVDPHEIARVIADDMPEDALRELAPALIANQVRAVMRAGRKQGSPPRSPRWEAVARASRLDMGWAIGDEWKRLRDCTRADIAWLIADYTSRAASNIAWRDAFQAVAEEMDQCDAETVGALPDAEGFVDGTLP